jgi:hypothetical protein
LSRPVPALVAGARLLLALALGLLAVGVGAAPASAAPPRAVDPATVTPTLNPDFAPWTCWRAGRGIICQGERLDSYENEAIDISCDGQQVYVSGSGRQFMTRWHDAEGRATRTVVHLDYPADVFSLSPTGDGPSVTVRGHWNRHYVYPVPGDRSSRVLTEVGASYLVTVPREGIVGHDTGRLRFAPGQDFEVIDSSSGPHDTYDDFAGFIETVCRLLT